MYEIFLYNNMEIYTKTFKELLENLYLVPDDEKKNLINYYYNYYFMLLKKISIKLINHYDNNNISKCLLNENNLKIYNIFLKIKSEISSINKLIDNKNINITYLKFPIITANKIIDKNFFINCYFSSVYLNFNNTNYNEFYLDKNVVFFNSQKKKNYYFYYENNFFNVINFNLSQQQFEHERNLISSIILKDYTFNIKKKIDFLFIEASFFNYNFIYNLLNFFTITDFIFADTLHLLYNMKQLNFIKTNINNNILNMENYFFSKIVVKNLIFEIINHDMFYYSPLVFSKNVKNLFFYINYHLENLNQIKNLFNLIINQRNLKSIYYNESSFLLTNFYNYLNENRYIKDVEYRKLTTLDFFNDLYKKYNKIFFKKIDSCLNIFHYPTQLLKFILNKKIRIFIVNNNFSIKHLEYLDLNFSFFKRKNLNINKLINFVEINTLECDFLFFKKNPKIYFLTNELISLFKERYLFNDFILFSNFIYSQNFFQILYKNNSLIFFKKVNKNIINNTLIHEEKYFTK